MQMDTGEANLALFIDYENLAIGARQASYERLDIELLLKRLLEKGRILYKRAYCDWISFAREKRILHELAIELLDIPQRNQTGKNSADIRMVVDALDLCYTRPHLDTFVIASGDSDFSPLVSKLREYDKRVVGVGVKNSTSGLLIDNCDEFIFYEDLMRGRPVEERLTDSLPKKKREVFRLLQDAVVALQRSNTEILWGSMVKQMMQRLKPTFDMQYYGYRNFSDLLRAADKSGVIVIERDERSGSYIVLDVGES